jgi:alpha-D-ribose 1-methylphosphonate 5-triphosphate synthase subunit PhnG
VTQATQATADRSSHADDPAVAARQRWMSVLARSSAAELEAKLEAALGTPPDYRYLRAPETGLVMVRGRAGGTGGRFNLGEMTVTRCAVQVGEGPVGHAYVAGRDARHATLAALFDALLQDPERGDALQDGVIGPLAATQADRRASRAAKAATTRVDFFTMVRGED